MPPRQRPLPIRFWEKVQKTDECWLWTGAIQGSGYGNIRSDRSGSVLRAHRIAWELTFGDIPTGMCVLHKCDVRECVNPDHLFLGTRQDNMTDRDQKWRGKIPGFRGTALNHAKLNECDVRNIRIEYAKGDITQAALANFFGVSHQQLSSVVQCKDRAWVV